MTILAFLILIVLLILVHEAGHFLAAKRSGVRVDEFGIGFPPRLFGIKKGETFYSINALPFGGFVKLHGEDGDGGYVDDSRSFFKASVYHKSVILLAGVAFNFIFAWILISVGYMMGLSASPDFDPRVTNAQVTVTEVVPSTPAGDVFKPGDRIETVSNGVTAITVTNPEEVSGLIAESNGPLEFLVKRGKEELTLEVTPIFNEELGKNFLGIGMDDIGTLSLPIHEALYEGGVTTVRLSELIVGGLAGLVKDAFVGKADLQSITGPVGIAGLAGDALTLGLTEFLSFAAIISIHLAILNLLPIPALDGGRLVIVFYEAIRKRTVPHKVLATAHAISFAILILLMIVVTYRDIVRLF